MPRGRKPKIPVSEVKKEKTVIEGNYLLYRLQNKPLRAKVEKEGKDYILTTFYGYAGPVKESYTKQEIEAMIKGKELKRQDI